MHDYATQTRTKVPERREEAVEDGNSGNHYGPEALPPREHQRLLHLLDGDGPADLLARTWEEAPVGDSHAYLQLVAGCIHYNIEVGGRTRRIDKIKHYVPDPALDRLPALTSIEHNGRIVTIGQHRTKHKDGRWSHYGTEVILGPVAERLQQHGARAIHPKALADATSRLISSGDVAPVLAPLNNDQHQDSALTSAGQDPDGTPAADRPGADNEVGPSANDPTITPRGWAKVKEVKSIAQRRYNGITVALGGWYSAYTVPKHLNRVPKHRPHSAAIKACVDLMPDKEIESLLGREPDGQKVKYFEVPDGLYDRITDWRPELEEHKPLATIFQKNLLDYNQDEDWPGEVDCTGMPIPYTFVFAAFGMAPSTAWNRGLSAAMLLEIYRRRIDEGFRWSGWSHEEGKCRIITDHSIPGPIIALAKHTRFSPDMEDSWTYLINGTDAGNRHFTADLREKRRTELEESEDPAIGPPEAAKEMQAYLNGLPQKFFGHGTYGKLRPEQLAKASDAASAFRTERRRDQANRKLVHMRTHPQPLYDFCDRFPRLKADPYNQGMNLPAKLRQPMYDEGRDYELDLDKAHLACYIPVVRREGIEAPILDKYIEANLKGDTDLLKRGDLWWDLASSVDTDLFSDLSALRTSVKRAYSAVYGSGTGNMFYQIIKLYADLTGHWPGQGTDPIKPIMEHPLMEELFRTRDKLEAIITDRGGLTDATGRFIPLSKWDGEKPKENRWRGCMAYVNCSYEQQIMYPIFREAEKELERDEYARFRVWLYQGDGVTINIDRRVRNHEKVIARLQAAVKERAGELGVPTRLTVDWPA